MFAGARDHYSNRGQAVHVIRYLRNSSGSSCFVQQPITPSAHHAWSDSDLERLAVVAAMAGVLAWCYHSGCFLLLICLRLPECLSSSAPSVLIIPCYKYYSF